MEALFELLVMEGEVWAWADDGHLAAEDIPELGKFIEGGAAEEGAEGEDAGVAAAGLAGFECLIVDVHGAEFEDSEGAAVDTVARLFEEEGPRGLEAVGEPNGEAERGEDQADDGERDSDIDTAFEEGIERILEGFGVEGDKVELSLAEKADGAVKKVGEVRKNLEACADAGGGVGDIAEAGVMGMLSGGDDEFAAQFFATAFDLKEVVGGAEPFHFVEVKGLIGVVADALDAEECGVADIGADGVGEGIEADEDGGGFGGTEKNAAEQGGAEKEDEEIKGAGSKEVGKEEQAADGDVFKDAIDDGEADGDGQVKFGGDGEGTEQAAVAKLDHSASD